MKNGDDMDNHNVNINCKEIDDVIDCNDKAQNTVKNQINVNNNYEGIEVVEECNDKNKCVEYYLNHNNVEERNPEDVVTNE